MTRPPRDVRADAKTVLARVLRNSGHVAPEHFTLELLAALDGAHLTLIDSRPPEDPNADWHQPTNTTPAATDTPTPGLAAYRAARGKTTDTTTTQESQQ